MPHLSLVLLTLVSLATVVGAGPDPDNSGTGWRMLFDGQTMNGWRSYRGATPPTRGWKVENGMLHVIARGGGGDIITTEQFGDFDLILEFKTAPKANSGIMYRVTEKHGAPWQTGPEFQVLDDDNHEGAIPAHSAGACYGLYEPGKGKELRPAGQWNLARVRIREGVVQHFLNGVKIVEYDMNSDEWAERIAQSKFHVYEGFGVQPRGHIALQDHGDDVWYRNIRIRELDKPMPGEIRLFNGQNLSGWARSDDSRPASTDSWSVRDGVLVYTDTTPGCIQTIDEYDNYILMFQWRFSPAARQNGDLGVLLRAACTDKGRLNTIEARLHPDKAGELRNLTGDDILITRFDVQNLRADRPAGEWNECEIIADGDKVSLFINGEIYSQASRCPERPGRIGLRSTSPQIQLKNIRLVPIK